MRFSVQSFIYRSNLIHLSLVITISDHVAASTRLSILADTQIILRAWYNSVTDVEMTDQIRKQKPLKAGGVSKLSVTGNKDSEDGGEHHQAASKGALNMGKVEVI